MPILDVKLWLSYSYVHGNFKNSRPARRQFFKFTSHFPGNVWSVYLPNYSQKFKNPFMISSIFVQTDWTFFIRTFGISYSFTNKYSKLMYFLKVMGTSSIHPTKFDTSHSFPMWKLSCPSFKKIEEQKLKRRGSGDAWWRY